MPVAVALNTSMARIWAATKRRNAVLTRSSFHGILCCYSSSQNQPVDMLDRKGPRTVTSGHSVNATPPSQGILDLSDTPPQGTSVQEIARSSTERTLVQSLAESHLRAVEHVSRTSPSVRVRHRLWTNAAVKRVPRPGPASQRRSRECRRVIPKVASRSIAAKTSIEWTPGYVS